MAGTVRKIGRLLIANRGEIAVRIARACGELRIESVLVASEADLHALAARVADRVVAIGPAAVGESYLRGDKILSVAKELHCDAIHPGYGFLSQNAEFADQVEAAGLRFVGPPGAAMRIMGDKTRARRAMSDAGVPVVPGYEGDGNEDPATLKREALGIGFPLLVKAAAGGGGRGMRIVREESGLDDAIESARREAQKAFGDGRLFLERFLTGARHVEIQVLADAYGHCIHLLERECSVQRRYQKILEESPSPLLTEELREQMGRTAVKATRACGYVGAGTVEFLVPDQATQQGEFFFLEMNTRLQVEHPVTELITGVDLVAHQLRVAAGERLQITQAQIAGRGHAIECRINAEDPEQGFAPSTGPILLASFPSGPGLRVDAGVDSGDEISIHYDSLVAKLLVHAENRQAAIARMERALRRTAILGIQTNLEFLQAVLEHPVFRAGEATTTFVEEHLSDWNPGTDGIRDEVGDEALIAMALAEHSLWGAVAADQDHSAGGDPFSPWNQTDSYRMGE